MDFKSHLRQMIQLRDRGAYLADNFGFHSSRQLRLHIKKNNGIEVHRIHPDPTIEEIQFDIESTESVDSIKGMKKIFEVKGVSKTYTRSQLENGIYEYEIDDGIMCGLIDLTENTLTWDLRLEQSIREEGLF